MSRGANGADADHAAGAGRVDGLKPMRGDPIAIPADDGAIQRAFAELDACMDAWLAGMNRAHEALVALASRAAALSRGEDGRTGGLDADAPAQPGTATSGRVTGETAAPPPAGAPEPALARTQDPAAMAGAKPAVATRLVTDQAAEDPPPAAAGAQATASTPTGGPAAAAPAGATPAERNESASQRQSGVSASDEALLASVDPEVAKAIRVRRRLNPNGKSVAELLEEYRRNPPASKAEEPKKRSSWWKRG